jgi:ketosteroid isomerase-like protein
MQRSVHDYLKALEAGDAERAAALFIPDGWVESPFLGRLPVRQFVKKVADSSRGTKLTVHDVLVSAEGHLRAVAYYQYDWRLKDDRTGLRHPACAGGGRGQVSLSAASCGR